MNEPAARILVVDDELPIRMTMSALLQRRGFHVEQAADGETALGLILSQFFDLLVLDLKMLGLNGLEVAQRARQHRPDVAILILTGHGSLDLDDQGLEQEPFEYLLKTASPQEVLARVTSLLNQRR